MSVIANLSARVGSIGDNTLGGWYSYRASKSALNQRNFPLNLLLFDTTDIPFNVKMHSNDTFVKLGLA